MIPVMGVGDNGATWSDDWMLTTQLERLHCVGDEFSTDMQRAMSKPASFCLKRQTKAQRLRCKKSRVFRTRNFPPLFVLLNKMKLT